MLLNICDFCENHAEGCVFPMGLIEVTFTQISISTAVYEKLMWDVLFNGKVALLLLLSIACS